MTLQIAKLAAAALLLVLPACSDDSDDGSATMLRAGESYSVVSIDGVPAPEGTTFELDATDRLAGKGPCNRYFGQLTREGERIGIGQTGATRMACFEAGRSEAETRFLAALGEITGTGATATAGEIALTDSAGTARIVLAPAG